MGLKHSPGVPDMEGFGDLSKSSLWINEGKDGLDQGEE